MRTLVFSVVIALPSLAKAAPLDDYASRPGWACAYGQSRTVCGGPGVYQGIEAEYSVALCGDEQVICGVTYKASGDDLTPTILSWAKAYEEDFGTEWLLQLNPAAWTAMLRSDDEIATLQIGEGYVSVQRSPAPECDAKTATEKLQPLLRTVLRMDTSTEWPILRTQAVGAIHEGSVKNAMDGPLALDAVQHAQLLFLSSEAFICYTQSKKHGSAMDSIRAASTEWREAQAMEPKELKALEKAKRQAEKKAKGRDIKNDTENLPEDAIPEAEEDIQ